MGLNLVQQSRESGKPPRSLKSPGSSARLGRGAAGGGRAAPGRAVAAPLVFAPRARCWLLGWDRRAGGCPAPLPATGGHGLHWHYHPSIPASPAWWPCRLLVLWATKEQSHQRSHPSWSPHLPHSPCQPKSLIAWPRLAVVRKACFSH